VFLVPIFFLIILAVSAFFIWQASLANELFCLSVREGRVLLVRGRVSPGLLGDFRAALAFPPVARATIRAYRDQAGARLSISGLRDEGREQRLRNIFNIYPKSKLRSAPRAEHRTLGQIIGLVWLAWLFERLTRNH